MGTHAVGLAHRSAGWNGLIIYARDVIVSSDCPCDTGPDVCCDTIFLKGDRIRTVAWNAVRSCGTEGCCEGVEGRSYTTLDADMPDPFGDSVIVAWTGTEPVAVTAGGHTPSITPHRATFRVQVSCGGWPILKTEGGRPQMPKGVDFNNASKHVMGHAEIAYRAIVAAVQDNTLWVSTPGVIFKGTRVSDLRPLAPAAYIARAAFLVAVDITL